MSFGSISFSRVSFGGVRNDLCFSLLFLVLASVLVAFQYQALRSREKPESVMPGIPLGDHSYVLTSHGHCVGTVELQSSYQSHYDLNGKAELQIRLAGKTQKLAVAYSAGFNALGQLAVAILTLEKGSDSVQLGFKEVNPISFQLKASLGGQDYEVKRVIPGPIELIETETGELSVRYRYLPNIGTFSGAIQVPSLVSMLDLKLIEDKEQEKGSLCQNGALQALDLDPLLVKLGGFMQYLQSNEGGFS